MDGVSLVDVKCRYAAICLRVPEGSEGRALEHLNTRVDDDFVTFEQQLDVGASLVLGVDEH